MRLLFLNSYSLKGITPGSSSDTWTVKKCTNKAVVSRGSFCNSRLVDFAWPRADTSRHQDAAADVVALAGNHARVLAGQEHCQRGDVVRFKSAADGGHRLFDVGEGDAAPLRVI